MGLAALCCRSSASRPSTSRSMPCTWFEETARDPEKWVPVFGKDHAQKLRRVVMLKEIRPAIVILVLLTVITGLAYPLAMTGIAGVIFPKQAQESLNEKDGKVI